MAHGATIQSMATCGFRMESQRVGLRIAMDIGRTLRHGVGLGLKTSLGDLRRSTMAAGLLWRAAAGAGCLGLSPLPVPFTCGRYMRPRWWRSSEAVSRLPSNSAVLSA
jgi:hypothetical protein